MTTVNENSSSLECAAVATNTEIQQGVNGPVTAQPWQGPAETQGMYEPPDVADVELIVYSHSSLLYWWPVWAVGYLVALLTYLNGRQHQIGDIPVWFHPDSNLGVLYFLT